MSQNRRTCLDKSNLILLLQPLEPGQHLSELNNLLDQVRQSLGTQHPQLLPALDR